MHSDSIGLTCSHSDALDLAWTHLVSRALTRSHMVSFGVTWTRLVSLWPTWSHMDSYGLTSGDGTEKDCWGQRARERMPGRKGEGKGANTKDSRNFTLQPGRKNACTNKTDRNYLPLGLTPSSDIFKINIHIYIYTYIIYMLVLHLLNRGI